MEIYLWAPTFQVAIKTSLHMSTEAEELLLSNYYGPDMESQVFAYIYWSLIVLLFVSSYLSLLPTFLLGFPLSSSHVYIMYANRFIYYWYFFTNTYVGNIFQSFFFLISWRLTTLQYCSGPCHTMTWISHGFTCVPHPNPPSHLPSHRIPLGLPSAPAPSTCLMHPTWTGDLFHTW